MESHNKYLITYSSNIFTVFDNYQAIYVFRKMYEDINEQKAKYRKEKLLVMGDFNCKIANKVSKSGDIFLKTVKDHDLCIINNLNVTEGKWTRIEGDQKSVIEYGLIFQDDKSFVNSVYIDEDKMITPFRIKPKDNFRCVFVVVVV